MSVKTRIKELNSRLVSWLNQRGIKASEDETLTSLTNKTIEVPLTFNQMSLMPTEAKTEIGLWDESAGCMINWNTDGSVTYESLVEGRAWPRIQTTYNSTMQVPHLHFFVDALQTDEFNMTLHWHGHDDNETKHTGLGRLMGQGTEDFSGDRTTVMADFGTYIVENQNHTNPPIVDNKYDLLQVATGLSKNYTYIPSASDIGGQHSFGKNNADVTEDFLMKKEKIDIETYPYLYYSINQAPESGCTFALYTNDSSSKDENNTTNPENTGYTNWYMYRDASLTTGDLLLRSAINYDSKSPAEKWMFGPQTGCIDMRKYVSSARKNSFSVNELKLYGYTRYSTQATFPATTVSADTLYTGYALYPDQYYDMTVNGTLYEDILCEQISGTLYRLTTDVVQVDCQTNGTDDTGEWTFSFIFTGDLTSAEIYIAKLNENKTACTFNYLFFGSEPTNSFIQGQEGECAYLTETDGVTNYTNVYHPFAAVGGPITLESIDYYVVGELSDQVKLKAVAITRPYIYNANETI